MNIEGTNYHNFKNSFKLFTMNLTTKLFLDVRLARFAKEKSELQDQISHLKLELEEEKSKRRKHSVIGLLNGPSSDSDYDDLQSMCNSLLI